MLDASQGQEFMNLVDEARRASVLRMLRETPFVAPVVASFQMSDLDLDAAQAQTYSSNV
jgi:hypothetical protein